MEIKTYKIGDLYTVSNGLSKGKAFFGQGYPFLTFSEVMNNFFVPKTLKSLVQTEDKERVKFSIQRGDIFLNRTSETADELGISCVALKDYPNATFNGFCKRLRPVAPEYIGYYLRTNAFRKHMSALSGNMITRASLRNEQLLSIEIELPPKEVQLKIANILRQYDLMIDNCTQQIALLEEAAQRLYREWFVNLRFPDYETTPIDENGLPKGWDRVPLTNMANVRYGYAFDGKKFNSLGHGFPILRIRNIPESFTTDYTTETASDRYIISQGDIVVGMDGEFHINSWADRKAYLVQRTCAIDPIEESDRGYLYMAIREPIKFFEKTLTGATVAHLGKKHLDSIEIIIPPKSLREFFTNYYNERLAQMVKVRNLSRVRDLLLPHLVSGQIEINA